MYKKTTISHNKRDKRYCCFLDKVLSRKSKRLEVKIKRIMLKEIGKK